MLHCICFLEHVIVLFHFFLTGKISRAMYEIGGIGFPVEYSSLCQLR